MDGRVRRLSSLVLIRRRLCPKLRLHRPIPLPSILANPFPVTVAALREPYTRTGVSDSSALPVCSHCGAVAERVGSHDNCGRWFTCHGCQRTWCDLTACTPAPFYVSAALADRVRPAFQGAQTPPCLCCGESVTRNITPKDAAGGEQWYECEHCACRFATKFIPLSEARQLS